MAYTKLENGIEVPFTDAETAQREAEEAAWAADTNNRLLAQIRQQRDVLIAATDWTQLPDVVLDATTKAAFITYRQALRNITTQPDLTNIIWPTIPEIPETTSL